MQQTAEIELYKVLKTKFSDDEAEDIIANLGRQVQEHFENRKKDFATKEDIAKLDISITNLRGELKEDIANLRGELKEDIANLRGELKEDIAKLVIKIAETKAGLETKMAETKAEMIKWMFIFWVGQAATTIAIVKLFMH